MRLLKPEPIRVDGHPFNDFIINRTPAGRWGKTEDLKGTAVFLASKASDFINGQIIYVDGVFWQQLENHQMSYDVGTEIIY